MTYKIIVWSVLAAIVCHAEIKDSVGTTEIAGKKYILHQISAGETLFSVARKYKLTINDLKFTNPELANGLKSNQIIKILMPTLAQNSEYTAQNDNFVLHKVEAGQTMYAISKKYNVSVEKIKKWNNMESNELKLGNYLIVGEKNPVASEQKEEKITEKLETPVASKITELPAFKNEIKKSLDGHFQEKGTAAMFEIKDGELYFFAMHKTAPIGTILKIVLPNEENYFARVVEQLPQNDSNLIKLSKMAFSKMALNTSNIVTIMYVIE